MLENHRESFDAGAFSAASALLSAERDGVASEVSSAACLVVVVVFELVFVLEFEFELEFSEREEVKVVGSAAVTMVGASVGCSVLDIMWVVMI